MYEKGIKYSHVHSGGGGACRTFALSKGIQLVSLSNEPGIPCSFYNILNSGWSPDHRCRSTAIHSAMQLRNNRHVLNFKLYAAACCSPHSFKDQVILNITHQPNSRLAFTYYIGVFTTQVCIHGFSRRILRRVLADHLEIQTRQLEWILMSQIRSLIIGIKCDINLIVRTLFFVLPYIN